MYKRQQQDLLNLSKRAWLARKPVAQGGLLKYVHGGEYHAYNPDVVRTLQQAVQSGEYSDYQPVSYTHLPPASVYSVSPARPQPSLSKASPVKKFLFSPPGSTAGVFRWSSTGWRKALFVRRR